MRPGADPVPGPRNRPRSVPTDPDAAVETPPPAPAPVRSRGGLRWGRLAAVGAALLAAGLWFAPAFVARSGLRHTVAHRLFPELSADVTVGRAELSWLAPVTLRDVTMTAREAAGGDEPLLSVPAIRTERPLHALLSAALFPGGEPVDYGRVTLEEPRLRVRVRPGGSDLEDALAPLLAGEASAAPPGFAVAVRDGAVTVRDAAGRRLVGRNLRGAVRRPAGASLPNRAEIDGTWGDGERSGTVAATLTAAAANGASEDRAANRWALRVDGLPLTAAAPLQTRFAADGAPWALDGALAGDLMGNLNADSWTAEGRLVGDRLTARRGDWAAGDRLRLATATLSGGLSGRFDGAGAGLRATRLTFRSDLGDLSADGPLPTALPADPATLLAADRRLSGRVDVAALAAQMPGVLGLADGATVEGGTLNVSLTTAAGDRPGARRIAASADLERLRAVLPGGERIAPDEPVSAQLDAVREDAGPVTVERLVARADGLSAVGRGTVEDLTADVSVDLAAFDRTFGRLLNLGGRWSGAADGTVQVRRTAADRFAVRAGGVGREIRFVPPAGAPVREEEVTVKVGVDLLRDAGRWTTAFVGGRAESGADVLSITPGDAGGLSLTLEGELATLSTRVAAAVGLPVDSVKGGLRASVTLRPAGAGWAVEDGKAELRRLIVDAPGLRLRESVATVEVRGMLDPAAGSFAGTFEWGGDALSVEAERVRFSPAAAPALTAELTARGDSGRLWDWFPAADAAGMRPEGRFTAQGAGTAELGPAGFAGAGFAGTVAFTDLTILTPPDPRSAPGTAWTAAWREPSATLAGSVRYDAGATRGESDAMHLGPLAVTAAGASLTAGGVVRDPFGAMRADLSGRLAVDWATLGPRLGTAEAGATLTGTSDRPFTLRGPLGSPADLSGRAGLGWDELRGGGFSFGQGVLVATLDGGRVRIDGVDWPLVPLAGGASEAGGSSPRSSVGRLRTTPTIDFTGREAAVRLPAGRVLSGVRFTPEATRGWLGLVSPLAAGAVQADGAFDVDLDGAAVPLSDLLAGDLRRAGAGGRLVVERADFTAGPVADGLLGAVRNASALLRGSVGGDLRDVRVRLPAQSTPFRLAGGRVYHQNLLARSGSVEVTTGGSVGLDGTLDLRAEIPLGGDLGGRRATVPIGGSLDAPRIDVARLADAAARGAIDNAVERERDRLEGKASREISRGLDRLFGRE